MLPRLHSFLPLCCFGVVLSDQPNPPNWPVTVSVFSPGDPNIDAVVAAAYAVNGGQSPKNNGQFSNKRFAFLFKPGVYDNAIPVGFYTTVHGLGAAPGDVLFNGSKGVYVEDGDPSPENSGALCNFWRSAENFHSAAHHDWGSGGGGSSSPCAGEQGCVGMLWAVSQASPLRRVQIDNDLLLFDYVDGNLNAGHGSGGFLANVAVAGRTQSGSQQQYFARNSALAHGWVGGGGNNLTDICGVGTPCPWNLVFAGVDGAPAAHCGGKQTDYPEGAFVTVAQAPVVAEKPFITIDNTTGLYSLQVPGVKFDSQGVQHTLTNTTSVPFESVFVAQPSDGAAGINTALAKGLHVVLTPGIYSLESPLSLNFTNQVLLGLGIPTLVATNKNAVVTVADGVDGARVAGVLLQAGAHDSPTLLEWGTQAGAYPGNGSNPGILHDVFARVGGPDTTPVKAKSMIIINSGHVIGDNLWLWRADHTVSGKVKGGANPVNNGLLVLGDDVVMYGLAIEHTLGDLLQWSGERGQCFFFQAEYPYDVDSSYGKAGYAAYRVNATVSEHSAYGVGVYHYFRDFAVTVQSAVSAPSALESSFVSPLGVYLSGQGTMNAIVNNQGHPTSAAEKYHAYWLCPS